MFNMDHEPQYIIVNTGLGVPLLLYRSPHQGFPSSLLQYNMVARFISGHVLYVL